MRLESPGKYDSMIPYTLFGSFPRIAMLGVRGSGLSDRPEVVGGGRGRRSDFHPSSEGSIAMFILSEALFGGVVA